MGSINLQIAVLHDGSAANATENADVPRTPAASPVLPAPKLSAAALPNAQQDTVSLSGKLLPQQQQQNSPSAGSTQPRSFTLSAQTTTFPPGQEPATAVAPSPNQNNSSAAANSASAQTNAATQSPVATASANADATTTAISPSGSSAAPAQQTLQQLDRVLRQLGIDPQSLSLISREGLLNWVNDPAALRQIVQDVQAAANSSQQNAAVGSANPAQTTAQLAIASVNQNQIQSAQTQNQPQAAVQANPASSSSAVASSANTNSLDQSAATAQQNATAVAQFHKLRDSLGPSGTTETQPGATSSGTTTPQGQLLNISA